MQSPPDGYDNRCKTKSNVHPENCGNIRPLPSLCFHTHAMRPAINGDIEAHTSTGGDVTRANKFK